jgi:leucyl/phenylalanyl-tRNA--protein transferase
MAVYLSSNNPAFPHPESANPDGLLAIGGKLGIDWLLTAYEQGIFPWFDEHNPILWWSPNPRLVLFPTDFILRKSLKRVIKQQKFDVRFDTCFGDVIENCAQSPREDNPGTWITAEMKQAYSDLHEFGAAHSVEVFSHGQLVGGLYGVSLGKAFFGESMFFIHRDASKVALYYLCHELSQWGFHFIDAQVETSHLMSLGAIKMERSRFLQILETATNHPTCLGKWTKTIHYEF